MRRALLFAVGSPLVVDYEETCARLGIEIVAAIKNRAGAHYVTKCDRLIGPESINATLRQVPFICPLFTPANRWTASCEALAAGLIPAEALIDPTSVVASSSIEFGIGSYVNAAVVIGGCSRIGAQVVVNRSASLGHHVVLEDFVSIGPGAILAGQVNIGRGSLIGAGSVILPKVRIGAFSVVAAGSIVTRDVEDRTLVVGCPARIVKRELPNVMV